MHMNGCPARDAAIDQGAVDLTVGTPIDSGHIHGLLARRSVAAVIWPLG